LINSAQPEETDMSAERATTAPLHCRQVDDYTLAKQLQLQAVQALVYCMIWKTEKLVFEWFA